MEEPWHKGALTFEGCLFESMIVECEAAGGWPTASYLHSPEMPAAQAPSGGRKIWFRAHIRTDIASVLCDRVWRTLRRDAERRVKPREDIHRELYLCTPPIGAPAEADPSAADEPEFWAASDED